MRIFSDIKPQTIKPCRCREYPLSTHDKIVHELGLFKQLVLRIVLVTMLELSKKGWYKMKRNLMMDTTKTWTQQRHAHTQQRHAQKHIKIIKKL